MSSSRVDFCVAKAVRKRPIPCALHGVAKVKWARVSRGAASKVLVFESRILLTPGRGRTNTVVLISVCTLLTARISSARLEAGRTDAVVIDFAASAPLIVVATLC